MNDNARITVSDLAQFTGTENYYKHFLGKFVYTDGVKFLAEKAGAYWLLDLIFSCQTDKKIAKEKFQCWKLEISGEGVRAVCTDGNYNHLVTQEIGYSDFSRDILPVELCLIDNVLLLTSEY